MSKKHAYWQLIWASILALTLAGVGMGFYLTSHPEGPETGVEEEKKIAFRDVPASQGSAGVSLHP